MRNIDGIFLFFYLFGTVFIFSMLSYSLGYSYMPYLYDPIADHQDLLEIISIFIFTLMMADFESKRDNFYIRNHLNINHTIGAMRRAGWVFGAIFMLKQPFEIFIPMAGFFSLSFNRLLNWRRNHDQLYLSTSNRYDKMFIRLVGGVPNPRKLQEKHRNRAGVVKMVFEAIATLSILIIKP